MIVLNNIIMMFYAGGEKGGLLDVNPGLIFWTVITFISLLLILKKVAWKPILSALSERENFIKDSLDKAENSRIEAEKLLRDNNERLAKAEEDAQKIISQSREMAEKLKNQILEESAENAKKMIHDAKAEIERKNQEAFINLKTQIVDLAVDAAEKIIKENLDKEKQKQIVDQLIQKIPNN